MNKKDLKYLEEDIVKGLESHKVTFKNKHGEVFNVHWNDGISVALSGDEVNAMVVDEHKAFGKYINLFNPHFSIWSKEELNKLGKALQELTDD